MIGGEGSETGISDRMRRKQKRVTRTGASLTPDTRTTTPHLLNRTPRAKLRRNVLGDMTTSIISSSISSSDDFLLRFSLLVRLLLSLLRFSVSALLSILLSLLISLSVLVLLSLQLSISPLLSVMLFFDVLLLDDVSLPGVLWVWAGGLELQYRA